MVRHHGGASGHRDGKSQQGITMGNRSGASRWETAVGHRETTRWGITVGHCREPSLWTIAAGHRVEQRGGASQGVITVGHCGGGIAVGHRGDKLTAFFTLMSASCLSRTSTSSWCPLITAIIRAVLPSSSTESISAPSFISSFATSLLPFTAAVIYGVSTS